MLTFGTLCLFHLHRHLLTSTCPWRWNRQSVPKRWHINSRRRVITQKKAYNIQNTAKAWNQELDNGTFQPQILTAFHFDWQWTGVMDSCGFGFGLHMVEGRYYRTVWNQFYPVFNTLIKNMTEEAKLFNPPSYFRASRVLEWMDTQKVCWPQICKNITEFDINRRMNWKEKKTFCVPQVILLGER